VSERWKSDITCFPGVNSLHRVTTWLGQMISCALNILWYPHEAKGSCRARYLKQTLQIQ